MIFQRRNKIYGGADRMICADVSVEGVIARLALRILFGFSLGFLSMDAAVSSVTTREPEPIRIQIGGEPSTLDPARVIDQYGFSILRNVIEGLFKLDAEGRLEKGLVFSHEVSKGGLVHRMKLRSDARWSDGKPVTLDDCIYGLRRALNPETAAPNADSFFAIKNAGEVFSGKMPIEKLGVRKDGDQLVIELDKPDPALPFELTLPVAAPARQDAFDAHRGKWDFSFPVTGVYRIQSYRPGDQIELVPNQERAKPAKRRVIFKILTEEITAMNLFEAGRLDVISTITATEIERLKRVGLVQTFPSTTVFYLSFNVSRPPFNDPDWRRAIASSVDRNGLGRVLQGAFEPTTSYLPKSFVGRLPDGVLTFKESVAKIKAFPDKPRIKLAFGASAFTKVVAEKIQSDFAARLGLKLELEPSELKTLLGRLRADPPDMYFLGMSAIYDDPMNHLTAFANFSAPNFSRYRNPEFENLLMKIKRTSPGEERDRSAHEANRILVEKDVVVVPIVQRLQIFGVSKKLRGFHVNPYQVIQLQELEK